jgi:hypothetical protein
MTDYGHDLHFGTSITPVAQPPDLLTPIGPRRRVKPTISERFVANGGAHSER